MKRTKQKFTLDQPAIYRIKVPGHLDERWAEWAAGMTLIHGCADDGTPITTLTGPVDQAALHSLLRRIYSLGIPLIAVQCVELQAGQGEMLS